MNHNRTRRWAAGAAITTLLAGVLSLVLAQPASANHVALQVVKELNATNKGGTITLDVIIPSPVAEALNVDFEIEGGPVEGDISRLTPDRSCTVLPNASKCAVPVTITSSTSGSGLVRAWIDDDNDNASVDADVTEGRLSDASPFVPVVTSNADCRDNPSTGAAEDTAYDDCASGDAVPGSQEEQDDTDVVSIAFSDAPALLDCSDSNPLNGTDTEVDPIAANETIKCSVTDSSGNRVAGARIDGEHTGANDPNDGDSDDATVPDYDTTATGVPLTTTNACTTGESGTCSIVIDGSEGNEGTGTLCFWLDDDNDAVLAAGGAQNDGGQCGSEAATPDDSDLTDVLTVTWASGTRTGTFVDVPETGSGFFTAQAGSDLSIPVNVYDQFGDLFTGVTSVQGEVLAGSAGDVDGSAAPRDTVCSTSSSSSCSLPVRSTSAGDARLCAFIGGTPAYAGTGDTATCGGESTSDGTLDAKDVTLIKWTAAPTPTPTSTPTPGGGGSGSSAQGYSLVGADGSLYAFGSAKNFGDMKGKKLNAAIIGVAYTPGGNGYWLVAKDGGIFSFGDADFYGSMGDKKLNAEVLGMAATPTGKGYWLFAGDGGIFSFGDAQFFGSMGDKKLNKPVIQMEPLASGTGYWLVAEDGGIFSFGAAEFHGSRGGEPLNQPIFDMTSTDTDGGYWLIARDGGVFSYGDAGPKFFGNPVNETNPKPTKIIGMDSTPTSKGYWIGDATGKVWNYGDAQPLGDRFGASNPAPMIGLAAVPK